MTPIPVTPLPKPGETVAHELARLRDMRQRIEGQLAATGHVGCQDLIAILNATKAPGS